MAASVFNVRNATCGGQCNTCNGATEVGFSPASYAMAVGGNQNGQFQITWNGGSIVTNPSGTSWLPQNSSIATVGSSSGIITGQSPGQTGVTAMVEDYPIYIMNCSNEDGSCPYEPLEGQAPTSVQPSISGTNTVWSFSGKNPSSTYPISVTLTSSGGSSTSWSVSQPDSKVSLSSSTGSSINVTCTGSHFSSQNGDISITATANGQTSAPFTMTAKTPWKLTAIPPPQTFCNTSPQTYSTELKYNLIDNLSVTMSTDVGWNESFGTQACENQSNWCDDAVTPGGGFTDPLTDVLAPPPLNFNPAPSPAPTCTGQPLGTTRYRSIPQTMHVGDSGSGGVQVQSDTLGYYGDHGQHDSIQSPSQPPQ